jgi:hypothetical protein
MRSILELSCWMPLIYWCKMIPLMFSLTLVLLFQFSILRLDNRTMFSFQLDHQLMSQLVCWYMFKRVNHLHGMNLFWLLIDLLQWKIAHVFLVYPNGLPKQLKLLDLMSEMFPPDNKLEFKINMSALHWWLVYFWSCFLLLFSRMTWMRIGYADENWFFVEESHLRLGSMTARKEHCEVSVGLHDQIYLWRCFWVT